MALKIKCDDDGVVELLLCPCGSAEVSCYKEPAGPCCIECRCGRLLSSWDWRNAAEFWNERIKEEAKQQTEPAPQPRFDFEANAVGLCEAAKRLREAADLIEAVAGRL